MGKIGYAVAADVAAFPGLELGMYMFNDLDHFKDAPTSGSITSSGGHALITKTNHGRSTGEPVDIDSGVYAGQSPGGHFTVERIDANTFKIRTVPGGALVNWISNTSVTYYPIVENGFYIASGATHIQKNFSLGDAYTGTYAADNHRSDGKLKYIHGDDGTSYSGPIGKHVAWLFPDHSGATITNSGGKALVTYAPGHGIKRGMYGKIKFSTNYNTQGVNNDNYFYFEPVLSGGVRSNTQFMLRPNATSDFVDYVADETVVWAIVPGASQMSLLDWKNSDPDDPGLVFVPSSTPGQINMRKTPESVANYCFEIWGGAENITISGDYDPVNERGSILYRGWAGGYTFARGKFGVYFEHKNYLTNNPCFYFSEGNGIKVRNVEIDNGDTGFCGFMAKNDAISTPTMNVTLEDYFIHNIGDGECIYIGETTIQSGASANTSHGVRLRLVNGVSLYSGAELLQAGQMVSGSYLKNFVCFSGSNGRYNPFTTGQGQGIQIRNQEGGVSVSNFVVDGYNFYGIYSQSDHGSDAPAGGQLVFDNFYLGRGSNGLAVFYDGNNDETLEYYFKDFYMKYIDEVQEAPLFEAQPTETDLLFWTVSENPIVINNGFVDSDLSGHQLFEGTIGNLNLPKIARAGSVADYEYENSGWDWHDPRKILIWNKSWDAANFYLTDLRGMRIPYQAGNVFRDHGKFYYLEEAIGDLGSITNSGGDALITCQHYVNGVLTTKNHGLLTGDTFVIDAGTYAGTRTVEKISDSTFKFRNAGVLVAYVSNKQISYSVQADLEPRENPSIYTELTWDSTGKCSKEVGHNPALVQYAYPPEDFRPKSGSVYARKNIGLLNSAADAERTRYEWEFAYDDGGSPDTSEIRKISIKSTKDNDVAELVLAVGSGNHVRRKSTPVDVEGNVGSTRTESFVQVN